MYMHILVDNYVYDAHESDYTAQHYMRMLRFRMHHPFKCH